MRGYNGWLIKTIYGAVFILRTDKCFPSFNDFILSKREMLIKKLNRKNNGLCFNQNHLAQIDLREDQYFMIVRPFFGRAVVTKEEILEVIPVYFKMPLFLCD